MRILAPTFLVVSLFVACGGGAADGHTASAPVNAGSASEAQLDAGVGGMTTGDPTASNTPDAAIPPKLCGCALCEPRFSDDACSADADCAPATPCHADRCVAKAKAKPRTPDIMCTEILRCDSVDANTCGCLKGKCALYPKK